MSCGSAADSSIHGYDRLLPQLTVEAPLQKMSMTCMSFLDSGAVYHNNNNNNNKCTSGAATKG
jgi:hypothetical protein